MTAVMNDEKRPNSLAVPSWYEAGLNHVWLPYSQMKTARPPLAVARTQGCRIVLADGRELIDGLASWWTACHGYNHPHIHLAVLGQLSRMPHVMLGGLVHEKALVLARRLATMLPGDLDRVFFSESGSVAVEVAMKMAAQYWANRGHPERQRFIAFKGGYHGDTTGAMAISDPGAIHGVSRGLLPRHTIMELPVDADSLQRLEEYLERRGEDYAAIIVEPLVQGAGGMKFHDPTLIRQLRITADVYGVLLIFDEIFTGFGRTGAMFACEEAAVVPDIITVSKALTGGTLPLAATVARRHIFEAFWSDDPRHALMHGPTYMANALACAAANASLDLFEREPRLKQVQAIAAQMQRELAVCRGKPNVKDVRVKGAIGVVELDRIEDVETMRAKFIEEGVFIRPFGNIVYLTPAFTITPDELSKLTGAIAKVIGS